ncbi:MAG: hypothetical protein QY326_02210 [Bdellovibrionota bacterium]|nr:MAG: hypothetical protein QY326_02210 [Bdellovibrionota bacterium]
MIESESLFDAPNGTGTPERRLLLAVLERAILDFVGNDQREIEEAAEWLFSDLEDPEYGEFSFAWICRELDLDYKKISQQIREMPKRGNSRIAPWYINKDAAQKRAAMN